MTNCYIRRIFRLYSGIDTVPGISFQWSIRSDSKAVRVSATNVIDSKYLAIKSILLLLLYYYYYSDYKHYVIIIIIILCTSRCRADKYTITKLLYDVKRVSEYESNIDGYEVLYDLDSSSSIRRFK